MASFKLNGDTVSVDIDKSTPLLWVLRDSLNMTGTKFGCGVSQCGACTIHLDGKPIRSCVTPVSVAEGKQIVTKSAERYKQHGWSMMCLNAVIVKAARS